MQNWMQHALIAPASTDPAATDQFVNQPEIGSAAERLGIYQRSYYDRLLTCMREQYPALCHALGPDLFNDFTLDYLRVKPPDSYTLYDLGRRFADHLAACRPDRDAEDRDKENWIDFMIDLAQFERQIFVMFDAPGHEGKPFASTETPDDRLKLQRCFAICDYGFPVARYYHDVKAEGDPAFPPAEIGHYALVRKDFLTRTLVLTEPQYRFLELMLAGESAPDALCQSASDYALDLDAAQASWDGLKQSWLNLGFFVDKNA
ncbi:DUF2063 domain-containing protein [Altererythrobacter aestiaquae]|uniref:DUF2063 domain-containing protein n=2 Tax=Pontixanthobacter aestiaquae TaxID=1509367 RepID=A0A844Z347_9SPHN|nr:DUF2063 domain-containing protein [Pontixanthobacter aestiaquae]